MDALIKIISEPLIWFFITVIIVGFIVEHTFVKKGQTI